MTVRWTPSAVADLVRLRAFLEPVAAEAVARIVVELASAPDRLIQSPRLGEQLEAYQPREVRRLIIGRYEMRYELAAGDVLILNIWHGLENRPASER